MIIVIFIDFICAAGLALYAYICFVSKDPVSFWTGSTIRVDEITDVALYNFANGILWSIYSMLFVAAALLSIVNDFAGFVMMLINCTLGLAYLVIGYHIIKKRFFVIYRNKNIASRLNDYK